MSRFDLHQDKAGKKSKELFRQLVVVQFFTLLISGLVLGVFFTLLIYCFYDNDGHRYRRSGRRLGYRRHYAKRHYDPKAVQHKGPLYDYVINEHGYPTLPVAFGVAYLAGMGLMGGVIVIGGYYKFQELKEGGVRVAESLAATEIPKTTGDEAERTLLNIVQELALASGISVPTAYVLKGEKGINA